MVETQTRTEVQNDVVGVIGESGEHLDDLHILDSGWPSLPKRYAVAELSCHIHLRVVSGVPTGAHRDYCAVLKRANITGLDSSELHIPDGLKADLRVREDAGGEVQRIVLVPVRQTVGEKQVVTVAKVPSLVRLRLLDKCEIVGMNLLGELLPDVAGAFVRFRGVGVVCEDGVGGPGGPLSVGDSELVDGMVEGGTHVVDGVSDDGAPPERRVFPDLHIRDALAGLDAEFRDRFVRVTPKEPLDGAVQRLDVIVCPV